MNFRSRRRAEGDRGMGVGRVAGGNRLSQGKRRKRYSLPAANKEEGQEKTGQEAGAS